MIRSSFDSSCAGEFPGGRGCSPTRSSRSRTGASSASATSSAATRRAETAPLANQGAIGESQITIQRGERRCRKHRRRPRPSIRSSRATRATSSTSTAAGASASRPTPRMPTWPHSSSGLPNDECQCEHMGYVIKGKVAFRSGDTEEVFEGGDAYYVGPGTPRSSTPAPRWWSSAPPRRSVRRLRS